MTERTQAAAGSAALTSAAKEFRAEQYDLLVTTYRQHFDLFLKGLAIYVAAAGTALGFVFVDGVDVTGQRVLLGLVSVWSGIAAAACDAGRRWAQQVATSAEALERDLDGARLPLRLAERVAPLGTAGAVALLLLALGLMFVVPFSS